VAEHASRLYALAQVLAEQTIEVGKATTITRLQR